jgi:hypothetical protein
MLVLYCAKVAHTPSCRMGLYACISLYLHGVVLRKDFPACVWAKFWSRKIECKKDEMKTTMPYWKRLVLGEKVLIMMRKHHLVMHLGMDHPHHHYHQKRMAAIKSRIVSSHRN